MIALTKLAKIATRFECFHVYFMIICDGVAGFVGVPRIVKTVLHRVVSIFV